MLHLLEGGDLDKLFGILLHGQISRLSPTYLFVYSSFIHSSAWTYGYPFYTLGYKPILLRVIFNKSKLLIFHTSFCRDWRT